MLQNVLVNWDRCGLLTKWAALVLIPWGCFCAARTWHIAPSPTTASGPIRWNNLVLDVREPYVIEITGNNDRWHVRYPGADGTQATAGNEVARRDVHVPLDMQIILKLKSRDFVYSLELPEYGLSQIAVPNLEFKMEFRATQAGRFAFEGDELCGDAHPELEGELIVEPRERFLEWLHSAGAESSD
ncbi:MAG TPA: hypothetical protein VKU82_11020 [Planctomycetaceae bacterium]|nr:hypothetical protein [Planctomycetaceae bacterium]